MNRFLINTVLLERNRWETHRTPSILVSEWLERFKEDGFDGLELWENHVIKAQKEEVQLLKKSPFKVDTYNSYVRFEDGYEEERESSANMIRELQVNKVKFNLGSKPDLEERYLENLQIWKRDLPAGCRLLCECHPGTIMEDPFEVARIYDELGSSQFEAIVHPFNEQQDLKRWFDCLGSTVTHAHVSLYKSQSFHHLADEEEFVKKRAAILRNQKFAGTYSMEFAKGTSCPNENQEVVYNNALQDRHYLQNLLRT
ncbi:hypothetical protein Q7A53_08090 [Halobacillus rhizosphaerae]|uniref:sugar phosphate isomerase/epimerase family protein n=1 Tax=Halobacillus rhizosphaerae TaxID=3064889 RepID=UPI00398B7E31